MSDDIQDFLRRAAQRRKARQAPAIEIIEAESVSAETPPPLRGSSLESHVSQHMDTSNFDERASHLGERIGHVDEELEAKLQRKFDHKLGTLSSESVTDQTYETEHPRYGEDRPLLTAADFSQLLSSPSSLRKAIVLSELFNRPEHRW